MKNNQKGFGIVEGLLILLVIGLVGFIGWHAYKVKHEVNNIYINSTQTTGKTPKTIPSTIKTINVSDDGNGKTITMNPSQSLAVTLASTYWMINESSNTHVIKMVGSQETTPSGGCVPGGGCGTAAAHFSPVATGTAKITASRTSCGEALACTGSQGIFSVTIVVR